MGEVLAPALGGTVEEWGASNRRVFPQVWARNREWGTDPLERTRIEAIEILGGMCDDLGRPSPDEATTIALMRDVDLHVSRVGSALYPAAPQVVEELASRYAFHTATGNPSWRVEAYFEGMGLRDKLGVAAGPDLVGIWKASEEYYDGIFALAGVEAASAVVVDDSAPQLDLAASRGARTVLIDESGTVDGAPFDTAIATIEELPAAVEALAQRMSDA